MGSRLVAVGLVTLGLVAAAAPAEIAMVDGRGQVTGLNLQGEVVPIRAAIRLPVRGWNPIHDLSRSSDAKSTVEDGVRVCRGSLEVQPGQRYQFESRISEAAGKVRLEYRLRADAEAPLEGLFFWLSLPQDLFLGGPAELRGDGAPVTAQMPVEKPAARHFVQAPARALSFAARDGKARLAVSFERDVPTTVQDDREYGGTTYTAFSRFSDPLKAGGEVVFVAELTATAMPDTTPANLTIDPATVRYQLHGFGGNYCFGIESPVTQYTLKNLRMAWARTEMTPAEWEPTNDNDSPTETNWAALERNDKEGSNLRREFQLARQIQDLGLPYVISIWILPEWVYTDPGKGAAAGRRKVAEDQWPEVCEMLGSYLLYAKRQYGVEPDLFSFNESDIGVRVLVTPEEHREVIKRLGAHFAKLGLKTRMLLGDTGNARGTHVFAEPAANDPEARQYLGAVAFHSWGGGTPAQYGAWAALAEQLKLPLLVTEAGTDAGAWRTRAYDHYQYAVGEMRQYQDLLLHARPQGFMQWEFTSDYGIVREQKAADGQSEMVELRRYHLVKQFCNLTPRHSDALATASDHPKVLVTAFRGREDGREVFTVHIVNPAAARAATLSGLPAGLTQLRAVRTSEHEGFAEQPPVPVTGGRATVELAAQSMLTLTTQP